MATKRRIDGTTPNGGSYSEIFFFDSRMRMVDETEATRCIIKEYKENGEFITQTYGDIGE